MKEIFQHAMTSVIAKVAAEQFQLVDPAKNKAITEITRNNIVTAGALMSVNIERAKKAQIDPEVMQELIGKMRAYADDWSKGIDDLEAQISEGPRSVDSDLDTELSSMGSQQGARN